VSGCIITKLPRTEKGRQMLLWWKSFWPPEEVYPDGVRHQDIDWDILALDCEAMEADYFAYLHQGGAA
jgi:hypothetical protein